MDVGQTLKAAWNAVEAAEIPEHLHPVAFEQAMKLLSGQVEMPAGRKENGRVDPPPAKSVPARGSGTTAAPADGAKVENEDSFFRKFAEESGLDEDTLRGIYVFSDGAPRLGLARRKLGESEAEKNRVIAMLMVAARWYVEGKPALLIGEVREAAKTVGHRPSRNLAKHLDDVPGTLGVGVKNDKAIRVQGGRFDAPFRELVDRIGAM